VYPSEYQVYFHYEDVRVGIRSRGRRSVVLESISPCLVVTLVGLLLLERISQR
jgi:hypothetical protein